MAYKINPSPRPSATDVYHYYPENRPFLNSEYERDAAKPVDTFPEGNRDAVMDALKALQDKIRQLELERGQAEANLRHMKRDTTDFQNGMLPSARSAASDNMSQKSADIKNKLDAAEYKCNMLERQLDYMRNVANNAEEERRGALEASARQQIRKSASEERDIRKQLEKMRELEREHLRLTATQTMSQSKIKDLENKLLEEQRVRRQIQQKAAEIEAEVAVSRILQKPPNKVVTKKPKKKKTKVETARDDSDHYRLNLGDIPFIAGKILGTSQYAEDSYKSVAPSHALGANFQEVVSLMKTHNNKLCKSPRNHSQNGFKSFKVRPKSSTLPSSTDDDLDEVLQQLQDEFARLSFSHQELNQQILECTEPRLRADLERELEMLLRKMETKGDQIGRLKDHRNRVNTPKSRKKATAVSTRRVQSANGVRRTQATMPCDGSGQIEVTTTIRSRRKPSAAKGAVTGALSGAQVTTMGGNRAQASRNLLHDLKKIQTTLKQDDVAWE